MDRRNVAGYLGTGGGRALIPSNGAHPLSNKQGEARVSSQRRAEGRETPSLTGDGALSGLARRSSATKWGMPPFRTED